jgi:fluoride exporter
VRGRGKSVLSRKSSKAERFLAHLEPLQPALEAYCRHQLNDRSGVEDVLQTSVARAFEDFDLYHEGSNFRAWIFRYLNLTILNWTRRRVQALGAATRYLVDHAVSARLSGIFPWGTFTINVSGSFVAGVVAGLVASHGLPAEFATVVSGGFLGAYTTFSTLVYETWRLLEDRAYLRAAVNLASLTLSLPVAAAGWTLAGLP